MFYTNQLDRHMDEAEKHLKKGEIIKAKDSYIMALSIAPDNLIIMNNLSQVYLMLDDKEKSDAYSEIIIKECDRQLANDKNEKLLTLKANALYCLKKDSQEVIDEILKINPQNRICLFQKSQYLEKEKKYSQAIRYINRILKEDPVDIAALLLKGRNLANLKRYDEAENYYNLVLKIEPKNIAALNLKAELIKKKTKCSLTAHDLMLKAMTYWEAEDYKSAKSYFDKALDMDSSYDEIWYSKGELLIQTGEISESIECFKKAFEINPSSGGIVKKREFFCFLNIIRTLSRIFAFEK